jgi:hypothetical protein
MHLRIGGSFVGSAVVTGAFYSKQATTLRLTSFAGEHIDYTVGALPDDLGAATFYSSNNLRPISVKIQQGGERCSVMALSSAGVQTLSVSLGTALALQAAGIRTVIDGGLHAGAACSAAGMRRKFPADLQASSP